MTILILLLETEPLFRSSVRERLQVKLVGTTFFLSVVVFDVVTDVIVGTDVIEMMYTRMV